VWGLTGDVNSFAAQGSNQDKVLEKCLLKQPTHISFKHCLERDTSSSSQEKRKSVGEEQAVQSGYANPEVEDLQMGEYFCLALS